MLNVVKDRPQADVKPVTKSVDPTVKNAATISWFQQCVHRGRNEVFSEVKTVTPAMAEVILGQNPDNRRIRPYKLMQLSRDMKAGNWKLNGEPIIIAQTGELNDGQHRLAAIVDAKISLPMLFIFGVERETRVTVDQGANRNAGDYLQMEGFTNTTTLAATARNVIAYERSNRSTLGRSNDITNAEILERVARDKTLFTSAKFADDRKKRMQRYCPPTVLGVCHNILLGENTTDGLAFMEQLCSGEDLKRGEPIFVARERLLGTDRGKTVAFCVEIIFRAWNAYRERRTMRVIPFHGRLPELV